MKSSGSISLYPYLSLVIKHILSQHPFTIYELELDKLFIANILFSRLSLLFSFWIITEKLWLQFIWLLFTTVQTTLSVNIFQLFRCSQMIHFSSFFLSLFVICCLVFKGCTWFYPTWWQYYLILTSLEGLWREAKSKRFHYALFSTVVCSQHVFLTKFCTNI